ncbi:hypothetical protein JHK82_040461 [Glycine max]|nr:hypothetical protein JHK82_040461 [Glycine max]
MSMTMQTAVGFFGGEAYTDGISEPLMMENVRYSDHPAVSSLNCPPFIAGVHPVDKRRTVSEYRNIFPAIDFSLDISWEADVKEKTDEVSTRGMKFLECFANCELRSIVIIDRGGDENGYREQHTYLCLVLLSFTPPSKISTPDGKGSE